MAKRKAMQGLKYKWEPQSNVEGCHMPGTTLSRGSRVDDGTVLGLSDNGEYVGVMFDHHEFVTEYTLEQFAKFAASHGAAATQPEPHGCDCSVCVSGECPQCEAVGGLCVACDRHLEALANAYAE